MVLEKIRNEYDVLPSQNKAIAQWKKEGGKVFGYMCTNFPEELIYAAGILPVRLVGKPIDIIEANEHFSIYMCHYARSLLELGLMGEYACLDGIVSAFGCEGSCNLFQVLGLAVPFDFFEFSYTPHNAKTDAARNFYIKELYGFKQRLEEYIGHAISSDDIFHAVDVYNENRRLLREMYDLRGLSNNPPVSGKEMGEVLYWDMSTSKHTANETLKLLITELKESRKEHQFSGPRIHLSGSMIPDLEIYETIEEIGGMVVSDDLCLGSRYFWKDTNRTFDPIFGLAQSHLECIPCSCMCSEKVAEDRTAHIRNLIRRYKVDGVVFAIYKWCDPNQMDRPDMMRELEENGVPVLSLEMEKTLGAAQHRTRLEAFFEVLRR